MITRLNLDCIATAYPYEYRAFSEAYSAFDDKYSPTGDIGEHARWVVDAVSDPMVDAFQSDPNFGMPDIEDNNLVKAMKRILIRFSEDGIRAYPVVLDSETQFEVFFGVENVSQELLDLMGGKVVTEEYEYSDDIHVGW